MFPCSVHKCRKKLFKRQMVVAPNIDLIYLLPCFTAFVFHTCLNILAALYLKGWLFQAFWRTDIVLLRWSQLLLFLDVIQDWLDDGTIRFDFMISVWVTPSVRVILFMQKSHCIITIFTKRMFGHLKLIFPSGTLKQHITIKCAQKFPFISIYFHFYYFLLY